ncbi:Elongation factor-like GTPase 1 [Bienertia sinuspersici]
MVIRCIPDPVSAQSYRITRLLPKREVVDEVASSEVFSEAESVRKSVEICDSSSEAPTVAFVSKMFAVPRKMIPPMGPNGEFVDIFTDENGNNTDSEECFLAFARVFSGVLVAGQRIYVLSALYDPLKGETMQKHLQEAEAQSLYMMMGQGLTPVTSVKAGNVVAIRGLGQHILKSATLSSTKNCWPFSSLMFQVSPMLKVAIEPSDPADMGALMKGLRLLNRADPFVEVSVSSSGEHVLAAAGEVHLERCIKDLKERFANVRLEVSPPLVSYKETIEGEGLNLLDDLKLLSGNIEYIEKTTPNGRCTVKVHVMKLPNALTKLLDENSETLWEIISGKLGQTYKKLESQIGSNAEDEEPLEALRKRIRDAVESDIVSSIDENDTDKIQKCKLLWDHLLERIWALGPGQVGPNLLITPDSKEKSTENSIIVPGFSHVSAKLGFIDDSRNADTVDKATSGANETLFAEAASLASSVVSGFQIATSAGPLCDEPMWGLAFVVEAYICPAAIQSSESENSQQLMEQYGMFTGQVMTAVKEACRAAVLQKNPRLVEAMYLCELNTPSEYLGPMYGVLARRRARVLKEEMQEGSPLFTVHAYLPVSESFGFADELRKGTSGSSSALLVLSHWEQLVEDPFFVPKTEEEKEEFGDGSNVPRNTARKLIDAVRRRKGLPVEEKIVQHATKQRTLARKV